MELSVTASVVVSAAPVTSSLYCDVSTTREVSLLAASSRPLMDPLRSFTASSLSLAPPNRLEKKPTTLPTPSASQPTTLPRTSAMTPRTSPMTSSTGLTASRMGEIRPSSCAMGGSSASASF